ALPELLVLVARLCVPRLAGGFCGEQHLPLPVMTLTRAVIGKFERSSLPPRVVTVDAPDDFTGRSRRGEAQEQHYCESHRRLLGNASITESPRERRDRLSGG